MRNLNRSINLALATLALSTAVAGAQAQWLTVTSTNGVTASGVFSGSAQNPAHYPWLGPVTVTSSKIIDGQTVNDPSTDGVPGIVASTFANVTPTFLSNWSLNGSGTFDYLSFTYNHTRDAYHVEMDFTQMQNGSLPAGTIFGIADLDIEEQFKNMVARDSSGQIITSAWLSPDGGVKSRLDYNNTLGDQTGSLPPTPFTHNAGVYNFTGDVNNFDSVLTTFRTITDVRSIEFDFSKYSSGNFKHIGGAGIALGYNPVPEPSSMAVLGLGVLAALKRRKRTKAA